MRGFPADKPQEPLNPADRFLPRGLERAFGVIQDGLATGAYPGAVAVIVGPEGIVTQRAFGRAMVVPTEREMTLDTQFDLASLTKPVATLTSLLILAGRGHIALDEPIGEFFPEWRAAGGDGDGKRSVTLQHLLTHTAGLPAWRPFYLDCRTPEEVIRATCQTPLAYEPGTRVLYSDLGFILLGEVVHRSTGLRLDGFADQEIFRPLKMLDTAFALAPGARKPAHGDSAPADDAREAPVDPARAAATEVGNLVEQGLVGAEAAAFNGWRTGTICGEANDGNCFYGLQGVAGHAGLFSTGRDLAAFSAMWLNGGVGPRGQLLSPALVKSATRDWTGHLGAPRGLGWSKPPLRVRRGDENGPFSGGDFLTPRAYGHTGFTGTSLWIDPEHRLAMILLTNRLHPRAEAGIIYCRPKFHNAVLGGLRP
ncbi:MAG TPA: serine hydrolase domain-containing protein [Bacillota bacterium]|jgi:CubicO group peptidase (beta-lactamase class C family)